MVKGDGVLLDGFERCFSTSGLAFLTGLAGADVFDDVVLHPRPVVVLCDLVVGVILSEVTSEGFIVKFLEGGMELGSRNYKATISVLSSSRRI